jgi:hypothetical protein
MRTTIRLDDHLLAEAKQRAARRGVTLTAVVEEALRESFSRQEAREERKPVNLPSHGHGWLRPGVDLDNNAALLDLMESEDDPS